MIYEEGGTLMVVGGHTPSFIKIGKVKREEFFSTFSILD